MKLVIEPAHLASFHPRQFVYFIHQAQSCICSNIKRESFGLQKRILKLELAKIVSKFNQTYLMKKILAPRSLKLGLARLIYNGFRLQYLEENIEYLDLSNLLFEIIMSDLVRLGRCVHFRQNLIFLLKPHEDEKELIKKITNFLLFSGLNRNDFIFQFNTPIKGFNFFGWHIKLHTGGELLLTPSFQDYQIFLFRVKRIVNNSNYGSTVKANKLYPIIREWKLYHCFINVIYLNSKYNASFIYETLVLLIVFIGTFDSNSESFYALLKL